MDQVVFGVRVTTEDSYSTCVRYRSESAYRKGDLSRRWGVWVGKFSARTALHSASQALAERLSSVSRTPGNIGSLLEFDWSWKFL